MLGHEGKSSTFLRKGWSKAEKREKTHQNIKKNRYIFYHFWKGHFFIHATIACMEDIKYARHSINSPATHKILFFSLLLSIWFFLIAFNLFILSFSFLTNFFCSFFVRDAHLLLGKDFSNITSLYTSIFENK